MKKAYEVEPIGILGEKHQTEQNYLMTMRLRNTKSMINTSCPKSFNTSKKRPSHLNATNFSKYIFFNNFFYYIVNNFETKRNNIILYNKLYNIEKGIGRSTISRTWKTPLRQMGEKSRDKIRGEFIKNEIKSLAQDNLFILKKLLEKDSVYKKNKMEKDYQRYQQYKSNICRYPAIDFTKMGNSKCSGPIIQTFDYNKLKCHLPNITKKSSNKKKKTSPKRKNIEITKGELSQRYYKEAEDKTKKKRKESIDKESSTTSKNQEEDESGEGSGSGSGSDEGSGSGSGEGSGSGSGSGEGSGSGSGSGENSSSS